MTKKGFVSGFRLFLVIANILILLIACSEDSNDPFETGKGRGNERDKTAIKGSAQSGSRQDNTTADLIIVLKEAKMALKESEVLLGKAKNGSISARTIEALERELQGAKSRLNDVQQTIQKGDFLKAKAQVIEITTNTNRMNRQIQLALKQRGADNQANAPR